MKITHDVGSVELCTVDDEGNALSKMQETTNEIVDFVARYVRVFQGRQDGLSHRVPEGKLVVFSGGRRYCRSSAFFQIQDGATIVEALCQSHGWTYRHYVLVRKSRDFSTNV